MPPTRIEFPKDRAVPPAGRLWRSVLVCAMTLAVISGLAQSHAAAAEFDPALQPIIESQEIRFDIGAPVEIRFSLWNSGNKEIKVLPEPPITRYFELLDSDGQKVAQAAGLDIDAPKAMALPPGGHYGIAFDLGKLFPRLKLGGTFRLHWKSGSVVSNEVIFKIVPGYDPKRSYTATLETSFGNIVLDFYPDQAPLAVRSFIELAYSGYFDGTRFFHVDPNQISGGDRGGYGRGTPGYTLPFEKNSLEMLAGTVGLIKHGVPPENSSEFFILTTPKPEMNGQFTAFAQVTSGLDVVQKISRVPNSGDRDRKSVV